jgi:hypothetical protein
MDSPAEASSPARASNVQPPPIISPPRESPPRTPEPIFDEVEIELNEPNSAHSDDLSQARERLSRSSYRRFKRRVLITQQTWWLVLGGAIVFLLGMILAAVLH